MAAIVPQYDKLPQGTGYVNVPYPGTDAAPDKINGSDVLPMDSHNPRETMQVMSIETTSTDAPTNPAPYWNSGEKENLDILG